MPAALLPTFEASDPIDLGDADPVRLLRAIAHVYADYERSGRKPGAEHWQSDTRGMRAKLIGDVLAAWKRDVGITSPTFALLPWHDDYVAKTWVAFRKLQTPRRIACLEQFRIPVPDRLRREESEL